MKNGPNKTVAKARQRMGGFPPKAPRPLDPFIQWVAEQARAGAMFKDESEARRAYNNRNDKE